MISFSRAEIRNISYEVPLDEFMTNYYSWANLDYRDKNVVLIYVKGKINNSCSDWVFDVPYIKGKDINNPVDVEEMIRLSGIMRSH